MLMNYFPLKLVTRDMVTIKKKITLELGAVCHLSSFYDKDFTPTLQ